MTKPTQAQIEAALKQWNETHQKLHFGDIREITALATTAAATEAGQDKELDAITIAFQLERIKTLEAEVAALTAAAEVDQAQIDKAHRVWKEQAAAAEVGGPTPNQIEQPKWPCTYPSCTCGSIKTDCVRSTIERCAQVCDGLVELEQDKRFAAAIRALKDKS